MAHGTGRMGTYALSRHPNPAMPGVSPFLDRLELAAVSGVPDRTAHDVVTRLERQGLAAPVRHGDVGLKELLHAYPSPTGFPRPGLAPPPHVSHSSVAPLRLPFVNLHSGALPTLPGSPTVVLRQSLQRRTVRPKWNQPWNQSACSKRPVGRRFPPATPGSRPRLPFCNRTRIPVHAHDITKPVRFP